MFELFTSQKSHKPKTTPLQARSTFKTSQKNTCTPLIKNDVHSILRSLASQASHHAYLSKSLEATPSVLSSNQLRPSWTFSSPGIEEHDDVARQILRGTTATARKTNNQQAHAVSFLVENKSTARLRTIERLCQQCTYIIHAERGGGRPTVQQKLIVYFCADNGRRKQGALTLTEPRALSPPTQPTPLSSQLPPGSPHQPCTIFRHQLVSLVSRLE